MKKIALLFLPLLLLGAGCAISSNSDDAEQSWYLTFNLPEGWVQAAPYLDGTPINLEKEVTKKMGSIYLQNTSKTIVAGGAEINQPENVEIETEFIQIEVTRLSKRRVVPEGEQLTNGFTKVFICDQTEECATSGQASHDYYLEGADANYLFEVSLQNKSLAEAETVILTAQEVK